MPRERFCEYCKKEMFKKEKENNIKFFIRKYCSAECRKQGMAITLDRRLKKSRGRHKDG